MENKWWLRMYKNLPLWAKVAAPFVALFLVIALFKALRLALVLGAVAVVVYFLMGAWPASKDQRPRNRF